MHSISYVGLDVHKVTIVAVADGGRSGEVRQLDAFANRADVLRKMVDRLERRGVQLRFCYEAGPCGYGLRRFLTGLGHACAVVAPRARSRAADLAWWVNLPAKGKHSRANGPSPGGKPRMGRRII